MSRMNAKIAKKLQCGDYKLSFFNESHQKTKI